MSNQSSKNGRLVIDVTQLIHWVGNLTGIPRVSNELAIRFQNLEDFDVTFIAWENKIDQMRVIDIQKELTQRDSTYDGHQVNNKMDDFNIDQFKQNHTSSSNLILFFSNFVKRIIEKIYISIDFDKSQFWHNLRSRRWYFKNRTSKIYNPSNGDKLLITWGEWGNTKYINMIQEYHDKGVQIIQMAYDMLPVITPQFNGSTKEFAEYCKAIYPISSVLISDSKHTKQDIIDWLSSSGLRIPPIDVFRLGEDFSLPKELSEKHDSRDKYGISSGEYLLCVGTIEARKNHTLLYYVYRLAIQKNVNLPKLLIVGRPGYHTENIRSYLELDPEVKYKIEVFHDVGDDDLAWLYRNCLFTIMPSFYEGWGLPIIESIVYGAPCLCSDTSSMTEIAENNVIHFSPFSTDECLNAIQTMLNPETLKEYRKRALSYNLHSWDDSFMQIIEIIRKQRD